VGVLNFSRRDGDAPGRRAARADLRGADREPLNDPDGDSLAPLLRRAGLGDQAAFAELYDQLAGLVHGVVLKVVRDPAQSEEVTQEVFVELWRLAARHDATRGTVRSWAATMAHRRAIDRVRSEQAARDRLERQGNASTVPDHDEVADEVADALDRPVDRARVRRSLDRLTPVQREAVELAYYGGHTYREVAVLLGVAEGTVKTRIRDGMIRLRDELGVSV
jgi:RNA polymerase sigma-70 factor (ECF subfamily)